MMGGDFAPLEIVHGIKELRPVNGLELFLFGDESQINSALESTFQPLPAPRSPLSTQVVACSQVIGMHEHPTKALKEKTDSSISVGFKYLAEGKIDAFISAGNTGAMLVGSLYSLKPIEGVLRPTISTIIPKQNGSTGLLLDVGLNSDCKPEQLNQFAVMGSVYAQTILGIENPRVALLNIGEEEGKGNLLSQATYPLLKENSHIQFVGNVEGRDIFLDKADVIVCDGFTGNIILKLAESLFQVSGAERDGHPYFSRFNFENYGGTPVLGISKPVIIGHGISRGPAFMNMILLAQKMIDTDVMRLMQEEVEEG